MGEVTERVRGVISKDAGVIDLFGMSVEHASEGVCEISCQVPAQLMNAAGFAHGTIAFTMMDTGCAYALASAGVRGVTTNANVTYVKAATADAHLLARVSIASRSSRVATLRGELLMRSPDGDVLLAHGTFVFQLIQVDEW